MSAPTSPPETVDRAPAEIRRLWKVVAHELPDELRRLRIAVLVETLADGVPVNPAAVTAVLSAHDDRADDPARWSALDVEELAWIGIHEFCRELDLDVPAGCREALFAVLSIGLRSGMVVPDGVSASALVAPLRELGLTTRCGR